MVKTPLKIKLLIALLISIDGSVFYRFQYM